MLKDLVGGRESCSAMTHTSRLCVQLISCDDRESLRSVHDRFTRTPIVRV